MITEEYYIAIETKYGEYTSWAIWADEDIKIIEPK
jgi:hypothetical protein